MWLRNLKDSLVVMDNLDQVNMSICVRVFASFLSFSPACFPPVNPDVSTVQHLYSDSYHNGFRVYWQGHNYVDNQGISYAVQVAKGDDEFITQYRGLCMSVQVSSTVHCIYARKQYTCKCRIDACCTVCMYIIILYYALSWLSVVNFLFHIKPQFTCINVSSPVCFIVVSVYC